MLSQRLNDIEAEQQQEQLLARAFAHAKSATLLWTPIFTTFPSLSELRGDPATSQCQDQVRAFLDSIAGSVASGRWVAMISKAYPELKHDTLHDMLWRLLGRCICIRLAADAGGHLDFIEFCSGLGRLTEALLRVGMKGLAFDKIYDKEHDMTTAIGLRLWIDSLSQTRKNSLAWFGTTCSPFVSLCKAQSKRRADNGYLGDTSRRFVVIGNLQMQVTSLLMFLSWLFGNVPVLEQPLNSVMPLCEPLKGTLSYIKAHKIVTWHGAFGGGSHKPLQLWTPGAAMTAMRRRRPRRSNGPALYWQVGKKYYGKKSALKASQAYSAAFGKAVADIVRQNVRHRQTSSDSVWEGCRRQWMAEAAEDY